MRQRYRCLTSQLIFFHAMLCLGSAQTCSKRNISLVRRFTNKEVSLWDVAMFTENFEQQLQILGTYVDTNLLRCVLPFISALFRNPWLLTQGCVSEQGSWTWNWAGWHRGACRERHKQLRHLCILLYLSTWSDWWHCPDKFLGNSFGCYSECSCCDQIS